MCVFLTWIVCDVYYMCGLCAYLIYISVDNVLRVWDVDQDHIRPLFLLSGHTGKITDILWQMGDVMASCSWDGSICLWDLVKAVCIEKIRTASSPDMPVSLDDGSFAHICYSKNINSADKSNGSVVAFPSPCLVALSEQGVIKIWQR